MSKAYFSSNIANFLATSPEELIGILNLGGTAFTSQYSTTNISWNESIHILKNSLTTLITKNNSSNFWHILLEYEIPRLSSRIDIVIIANDVLFVIEFKLDRTKYELADIRQVEDYALDLSDFHLESRNLRIIPVILAPLAKSLFNGNFSLSENPVQDCLKANSKNFADVIETAYKNFHQNNTQKIDPIKWENSEYKPTPTIIQAAKALFSGQKVEAISTSGADTKNLKETTQYLIDVISNARNSDTKAICFVTGVPGAGKTLVGLNLVHERDSIEGPETDTAYFSGNGPLINVLREALARDDFEREYLLYKNQLKKERPKKEASERKIKSKIQNLHSFIKEGIRIKKPPAERIVIFDEAQRCWDAIHFFNKSKQNQNRETNPFEIQLKSEAELLLEFMSRHEGWAVIIALIGGGQEINTGEAGISEWGRALLEKYPNWNIHISQELLADNQTKNGPLLFETVPQNLKIFTHSSLHLETSQRSFRAKHYNHWVNSVIANDSQNTLELSEKIKTTYPIFLTRKLEKAKSWLKTKMSGTKRIGLIASSGALRLKPLGIGVRDEINEAFWFLNDENDVRSSYYLELVATEYKVQGLELDWICLCWDADLRRSNTDWDFKNFSGTRWEQITREKDQQYLLNKYRVLLTRAREGIIIFIPEGDENDFTRPPAFYDPIYAYLKSCGVDEI